MKKINARFTVLALMAALALSTGTVQAQDADDKPDQKPALVRVAKGEREEHPVIRQAIKELQHTKWLLEKKAASDFRGHRVQAIQSIDQALEHLNQALQADTK